MLIIFRLILFFSIKSIEIFYYTVHTFVVYQALCFQAMAARRRSSYVEIASNPLENRAGSSSMEIGPKVESLAEALPILADELAILISELKNLP